MNTICGIRTDAELMQDKLLYGSCPYWSQIGSTDLLYRLQEQGFRILLIHVRPYWRKLENCQQCLNYTGEYPTMGYAREEK